MIECSCKSWTVECMAACFTCVVRSGWSSSARSTHNVGHAVWFKVLLSTCFTLAISSHSTKDVKTSLRSLHLWLCLCFELVSIIWGDGTSDWITMLFLMNLYRRLCLFSSSSHDVSCAEHLIKSTLLWRGSFNTINLETAESSRCLSLMGKLFWFSTFNFSLICNTCHLFALNWMVDKIWGWFFLVFAHRFRLWSWLFTISSHNYVFDLFLYVISLWLVLLFRLVLTQQNILRLFFNIGSHWFYLRSFLFMTSQILIRPLVILSHWFLFLSCWFSNQVNNFPSLILLHGVLLFTFHVTQVGDVTWWHKLLCDNPAFRLGSFNVTHAINCAWFV